MKANPQTIIIIGAGAAGLMAAKKLAKHYKVIVLEGSDRIGGRIHTLTDAGFSKPVESGPEFIHGKLPLTFKLLKKAGIPYSKLEGKMYHVSNGEWSLRQEIIKGWDKLMGAMKKEKKDMTLNEFLQKHYGGDKYADFRKQLQSYAEGFDLADIHKASMKALYKEWSHEDQRTYRIPGGHGQLIDYLAAECKKKDCEIITSSLVRQIDWEKNEVTVYTDDGRKYSAGKCIITVPSGILQNAAGKAALNITPPLHEQVKAAGDIGYGTVIKMVIEFDGSFWNDQAKDIGFILSDEKFPTWWTQLPDTTSLLTGWKGGPEAAAMSGETDEAILQMALNSLAAIFKLDVALLQQRIVAAKVFNWQSNPYASGAYSYAFPLSTKARKLLNTAVDNTIFFAGEGIYDGAWGGTVEAALQTAKETADRIMK
jgi:monoamine oxidase